MHDAIGDTRGAMAALGVAPDTLDPARLRHLDEQGFVILPAHMPGDLLDRLRDRTDELVRREGARAGHETPQGPGVTALADLINKGEVFERVFTDPAVLCAA